MAGKKSKSASTKSSAALGFEAKLWLTAASEGEKTHRSVYLLGRIYEHFLQELRFRLATAVNVVHTFLCLQARLAR